MTSPRRHLLALCALAGFTHLTACGDDGTPADSTTPDADAADTTDGSTTPPDTGIPDAEPTDGSTAADVEEDTTPLPLPDEECDDTLRPIIMAHGFLASGDTYGAHFQRFSANGYCRDRLFAYDWNTLGQGLDRVGLLDAFIQDVLTRTGATQVDLAGHSAGGGLGYDYLEDPERAARVAHYAHIGSFANDAPAGPTDSPVPTLNLYSTGDTVVDGADIPGATNVALTTEDHYGVATSAASFDAIFRHYNDGTPPTTTDIVPETRPVVAGRALSLGENLPAGGAAIEVWALDSATGLRSAATPVATFTADELGYWGPVELLPATHYEFFITPTGEDAVPIHYYREPFVRSNQAVYLRTLPNPDSLAGILLAGLPFSDDATILVNFTSSTGIIAGTDSLVINGVEMATEELASADQTTIALFLYDENQNGTSDNVPVATFASFPFLNGYDQFYAADPTQFIEVNLNGRILRTPRWPSLTDGVSITIFD